MNSSKPVELPVSLGLLENLIDISTAHFSETYDQLPDTLTGVDVALTVEMVREGILRAYHELFWPLARELINQNDAIRSLTKVQFDALSTRLGAMCKYGVLAHFKLALPVYRNAESGIVLVLLAGLPNLSFLLTQDAVERLPEELERQLALVLEQSLKVINYDRGRAILDRLELELAALERRVTGENPIHRPRPTSRFLASIIGLQARVLGIATDHMDVQDTLDSIYRAQLAGMARALRERAAVIINAGAVLQPAQPAEPPEPLN